LINSQLASREAMTPYFEHLAKMDLQVFFLMAVAMQRHDAGPWLKRIDVPTLIVAGENDQLTPLSLAHRMHDEIRGAEMLFLPKGSHAGIIEYPELISLRLEKFLRERVEPFLAARGRRS
jgi:pimeloyl-ACP methyl ester carboxylesterase